MCSFILAANQNAGILIGRKYTPGGTTNTRRTSRKGRLGPFPELYLALQRPHEPGKFIGGEYIR